jgi:hypothetical protein
MNKLFAAVVIVMLPIGAASAFQVVTPGQMKDAGMGFTQSQSFNQQVDPSSDPNFRFSASSGTDRSVGDNRLGYNRFGRMDGGGRYLGDNNSNFKSCSEYSDSNTAQLDNMSRGGNSYPCQRFR